MARWQRIISLEFCFIDFDKAVSGPTKFFIDAWRARFICLELPGNTKKFSNRAPWDIPWNQLFIPHWFWLQSSVLSWTLCRFQTENEFCWGLFVGCLSVANRFKEIISVIVHNGTQQISIGFTEILKDTIAIAVIFQVLS